MSVGPMEKERSDRCCIGQEGSEIEDSGYAIVQHDLQMKMNISHIISDFTDFLSYLLIQVSISSRKNTSIQYSVLICLRKHLLHSFGPLLPRSPLLCIPTVSGQGTAVSCLWAPKSSMQKRIMVRIHSVTATNITQPYAGTIV